MFILYGLLVGLAIGLVLHGRLQGLAGLHFRWAPLALIGFAAQLVLFSDAVAARIGDLGPVLYIVSTGMVLAAVLRNVRIRGMALVSAGAVCNLVAILANGGYMPTTPGAMAELGRDAAIVYSNSAIVPAAALPWLTDIFAMPRWLPFANVYSIGDLLIGLGIMVTVVSAMRTQPRRDPTWSLPASGPAADGGASTH